MANTNFLSTSELDFSTIKENLKTYLKSQDQFADYDFDGSNINVLLDILAYNTYLNSFYLNMVGSEMFLDTAQLKESVVSHAKELNYIPRSRASAEALVNITVTAGDSPDAIVIPENYRFTTTMDGVTYNFYTGEDHIIVANNGVYQAANVSIYEGNLVTEYFDVAANTTYVLQSETIDTRSIRVTVYESNTSLTGYAFTSVPSLFGLTPTSNVFFLQGHKANQYEITFGNGVTGRNLTNGNRVKVVYRSTNGTDGNGAYVFSKTSSIQGYSSITASTVQRAILGAERETVKNIKFNAPRFFTTQERAVTAQDYINLVKAKFPQFQAVAAYGGEDLQPPQYGKVAISLKPHSSSVQIVSDLLKSQVVDYLKLKNLTTEPIIIDPDILYLRVVSSVKYNVNDTTVGYNTLRRQIKQAIIDYGLDALNDFGIDFSYSKLVGEIDSVEPSIIGNETDIKLIKRWSPITQLSNTITFSYNNPLYSEDYLYELPQGHDLALYSSNFDYVSGNVVYSSYVGDNGLGTLKIYTDTTTNNITTRLSLNDNAGTVDYDTGEVTLSANVYNYSGSHISLYATTRNKDISIKNNEFLIISASDVTVTMVPVDITNA